MFITLKQLQQNLTAVDLLATYFDLVIYPEDKQQLPVWLNLSADEECIVIARESAGGLFLLGQVTGQIVYASSEGSAGCIATTLSELLQLVVAHPYWQDLLKFSGGGSLQEMQRVMPYLEESLQDDEPDIDDMREQLLACLDLTEGEAHIARLHSAVSTAASRFVIRAEDGSPYENLFHRFKVDDNPMWKTR